MLRRCGVGAKKNELSNNKSTNIHDKKTEPSERKRRGVVVHQGLQTQSASTSSLDLNDVEASTSTSLKALTKFVDGRPTISDDDELLASSSSWSSAGRRSTDRRRHDVVCTAGHDTHLTPT